MVWLNTVEENGNALYFDIYRTERFSCGDETRYSFAGELGDGLYEGEVQIEVGAAISVTFADAWLNPPALQQLFARSDRGALEAALTETGRLLAEQAESELPSLPRPHRRALARRKRDAEEEAALALV